MEGRMIILMLAALLSFSANAETTTQPADKAQSVIKQIEASGGTNTSWTCNGGECVIEWTPKPGRTVVFTDGTAQRAALRIELAALESKLDAGTITDAEFKRLVKIVLIVLRVSKDA